MAPGEPFGYILAYHNAGVDTLNPAQLNMQLPAGPALSRQIREACSARTDSPLANGKADCRNRAAGASESESPANTGANLHWSRRRPWAIALTAPLAQASDAKAIYATSTFSYALSTRTGPVPPGKTRQFTITSTNLSDTREYLQFCFPCA